MDRSELESKHLAELHAMAAEANIPRYRMLSRAELVDRLADIGSASGGGGARQGGQRRRRSRDERPRERRERRPRERQEASAPPSPEPEPRGAPASGGGRRKRRRRFGRRRRREVRLHELLLGGGGGRQAVVYAESRAACTGLLRDVAAELAKASKGPDPIAVLVDPSPEELADWRREAPRAEIVAAGQARHVEDALAQAANRAAGGEDVIVLVDSLTRFAEAYGDADGAREAFEAGAAAGGAGGGSLTLVAALEPTG